MRPISIQSNKVIHRFVIVTSNKHIEAQKYAQGGASVISILTEPTWFKGTLADMENVRRYCFADSFLGYVQLVF